MPDTVKGWRQSAWWSPSLTWSGEWPVPHASAHTDEVVESWFGEAGAFLFGRTSFDLLGGYWPKVTEPDDYRLLQYPVVVGTGKGLFPDGSTPATFTTVDEYSRVPPGGVVSPLISTSYRP
ncbi:hypothetical protein AB0K18_10155 [Nonomuraea sp. NPDC049421]|uniref:hypothetical protein n=1 Tax=Nonomuraea sp. NPDC049421 TaxID=3155275 RepID=UPI003439ADC0